MAVLAILLLAACWKPYDELSPLDFAEVPFDNPLVEADDAVISAFDTTLACPDGAGARFFAVWREGLEGEAPVAIVLHSGAFDYVLDPGAESPRTWRPDDRLRRGWAVSKVWETLGMNPNPVDEDEENAGALPAALTDAGFVQLYPGNCWGDLWHASEGTQPSQYEVDGFDRNGRTFAWWMVRMVVESGFAGQQGFSLPVRLDANRIYLVGLGEGGRGVAELLAMGDMPPVAGILVDSSPDLLSPYLESPEDWPGVVEGFGRVFREENLDAVDAWSLATLAGSGDLPDRVGFAWSSADPAQPPETMEATATAIAEALPGAWVEDLGDAAHVLLNADPERARAAVEFLSTGVLPD